MKKNKKKIIFFSLAASLILICFYARLNYVQAEGAVGTDLQNPQTNTATSDKSWWQSVKDNVWYGTGSAEQGNYELQKPLLDQIQQQTPTTSNAYFNQEKIPGAASTKDFVDYIKQIIRFGFATIGILALFMLSVGAYQYLMAAGNLAKIESAKETIYSALFGLILGLTSFLILRTINPQLVSLQLTSPGGVASFSPYSGGIPAFSGVAPEEIKKKVQEYASKYKISEDLALRLVNAESNFNPGATSPKGAMGLMQLMPGTASQMGVSDPYNIDQNLNGGMRYLKSLLDKYDGNAEMALAAYNWGSNNVDKNGIGSLPKETSDLLCKVLGKC